MSKKFSKVDVNQPEIVKAFRDLGWSWQHTHTIGQGCVDGFASKNKLITIAIEIKDGSKSPSQRKLTSDEEKWHSNWKGQIAIVTSLEDVLKLDRLYS